MNTEIPLDADIPSGRHSVRNSLIDKEVSYELGDDALFWRSEGNEGRFPYAEMREIALIDYPSFSGNQGQCTIRRAAGARVKIRSHHYQGLNQFDDRSTSYGPLIRDLCKHVAAANASARFVAGSTSMWLVYSLLVVLIAVVGILVLLAALDDISATAGAAGALLTLALVGLAVWGMMRRGRGTNFDPQDPPRSLLGVVD